MPIYRGEGGSGESSTNALVNEVAQDAAAAANSANEAASSATSAANSATAAANSAIAAAASETAAETAETNAETAETNAAASAAAAATSETNASTSETNAATSETNAATSASNASTSETNASASATAAATSATNAATSETNAATSATNAATSETNAATSASQAATSATSAATSASDAATTYDNFDDRYLGEKTSDPSVDNDGDALITGALYFNSTASQMRVWDGSAWEAAYLPASGYLPLSGGTMTGTLTLNANPASNLQAATKQYVDDVAAEGIQYHTPVRVEVEGNLTVTYNNGTAGVGATLTNAGTQAALVIDDITMVVNDRVLIYEQTDATQNGIYTVTDIGSASTNWILTRATDADSYAPSDPDALAQGSGFFVQEGTLGAGEKYVCNTVGTITFGTTNITFVQVATAQIYTGGDGIYINGSTITNTGLLTTGSTATDLAITSADINGGNIDGTIIGATTPAAATFATFTSNGIDDNATSTVLTVNQNNGLIIDSSGTTTIQANGNTHSIVRIMSGDDTSYGTVVFGDTSSNTSGQIQYTHSNDAMVFKTDNTTAVTIDASQNVSLSGSYLELSNGGRLQVSSGSPQNTDLTGGSTNGTDSDGLFSFYGGLSYNTGAGIVLNGADHATLPNVTRFVNGAFTERARINADGTTDFLADVFTTGDFVAGKNSGSIALTINDGYGNSNIAFNHQDGIPDQNGNAVRLTVNTDQTTGAYLDFDGKSNVTQGVAVSLNAMARMYADSGDFHAEGNVIAYSTSISDERLKENVEQVTGALDMLDQIRGVTFDRKDTGKKSAGVIAQELEQVMPYAIYETALPLKTGSEEDVYKLVEYDALHAVLIEAIKELRAEVEELRASSN
jgi:hypothetical protein